MSSLVPCPTKVPAPEGAFAPRPAAAGGDGAPVATGARGLSTYDVPVELEIVRGDVERLTTLLAVAVLVHLLHAVFFGAQVTGDGTVADRWRLMLALIHSGMALPTAALAVALRRGERGSLAWARRWGWLPSAVGVGYLVYGGVVSGVDQLAAPTATAYIVASTGLALLLRLRVRVALAAYGLGFAALVVTVSLLQSDPSLRSSVFVNAATVTALSVLIARVNRRMYLQIFADRRTIAEQARALESMNRDLVAEAAERARVHAEVEQAARIDSLTGVLTRRGFFEGIERLAEPSAALVLFDVDLFKRVNDTHGHAAGDRLLVAVAEVTRRSLRDGDLVGRLGGDELAVVLPRADEAVAVAVAERIRSAVAELALPSGAVTVSLGVAVRLPDEAMEPWLVRADQAMYRSKHAGRNRVSV